MENIKNLKAHKEKILVEVLDEESLFKCNNNHKIITVNLHEPKYLYAKILSIGDELSNIDIKENDIVIIPTHTGLLIEIEDKNLLAIEYKNIMAKVNI